MKDLSINELASIYHHFHEAMKGIGCPLKKYKENREVAKFLMEPIEALLKTLTSIKDEVAKRDALVEFSEVYFEYTMELKTKDKK